MISLYISYLFVQVHYKPKISKIQKRISDNKIVVVRK